MLKVINLSKKNTYDFENYVISFPKCGRTWLRVAIGKVFSIRLSLQDRVILNNKIMYKIDNFPYFYHDHSDKKRKINQNKIKYLSKNIIFLTRDPIDTIYSYYLHMSNAKKKEKLYKGSLSDFIRSKEYGVDKLLQFYKIWIDYGNRVKNFLHIKYEEMHDNVHSVIKDVLDFIKMDYCNNDIESAANFASFCNMKKMQLDNYFSSKILKPSKNKKARKVRAGKIGAAKEKISDNDKVYIENLYKRYDYGSIDSNANI